MRATIAIVAIVVTLFLGDYAFLRLRNSNNRFGTVQVKPYYAVKLKDGKTEFMFDQPQNETCSHSLFPQLGYRPCWYVEKHKEKRIDMK